MDHKPSNPGTDSFVDDRMARLDPSPNWKPDAARALERMNQRQPLFNSQWMRVGMTTTILAATVVVLVLLPWQRLWTPEPVATVAAQTHTTPAEKPVEQAPETPAPQPPAEAAPQAPTAPTAPTTPQPQAGNNVLLDLPDNEQDLLRYLEGLAKARGVSAQASPGNLSEPRVLNSVLPQYSDEARQAKVQGTVELVVTVKVDGTVQFESFKKTLGHGLDEKAREAAEQWKFAPATKDGVPVATMISLSMNFSLR